MKPRRPTQADPRRRRQRRTSNATGSEAAPRTHPEGLPRVRLQTPRTGEIPQVPQQRDDGRTPVSLRMLLVIVALLVPTFFIAESVHTYFVQHQRYQEVSSQLRATKQENAQLEAKLPAWQDNNYLKSQARGRLGYVMPGETTYIVVGADSVSETTATSSTPQNGQPWYDRLRQSTREAGKVPKAAKREPSQRGWLDPTTSPTPTVTTTP